MTLTICVVRQLVLCGQIKGIEIGYEKCINIWRETLSNGENFGQLSTDRKLILKCVLKKLLLEFRNNPTRKSDKENCCSKGIQPVSEDAHTIYVSAVRN
jgi:hypothetical protein